MGAIGSLKHILVARVHIICSGFAEALGHVHAVEVGQVALHRPVGCGAVELVDERQDGLVAVAVVEPEHAPEVVAAALFLPETFQELAVVDGQLPLEVAVHGRQHTGLASGFVVGLQCPEHRHLGPEVGAGAVVAVGTEASVGGLVVQHRIDPSVHLALHGFVVQDEGQTAVASDPVRNLFPSVVALVGEPLVVVLVEPCADGAELTVQSVALQFEVFAEPASGLYLPDGQLQERRLLQGFAEVGVVRVGLFAVGAVHDADVGLCLTANSKEYKCQEKKGFVHVCVIYVESFYLV